MGSRPLDLFRRLTNGVYVVGVSHGGRSNAFTAAWVTQVSFDPLLLALSVNPDNFSYSLLKQSGVFVLNVLPTGQLDVARRFGTQSGRTADKLSGWRWHPGTLGAPILEEAAAYLECRVVGSMSVGDHQLIVGQAVGGDVTEDTAAPMSYAETGDADGSATLYPASF
jgi:flavin reductase (DIM6/NTAB) family NADH-FMN oxidoreductase RutF